MSAGRPGPRAADSRRGARAALWLRARDDLATDELVALGVRRPRRESRNLDALTPSEERVARMAASGMTSREIVEALYVTPKTVDTHLYHVYAKLEISSRRQLTRLLQHPNR